MHEDAAVCIFCGGVLAHRRSQDIAAHFSGEVETVQLQLRTLRDELNELLRSAASLKSSFPERSSLFEDLRGRYDTATRELRSDLEQLESWAKGLQERVSKKLENVLDSDRGAVSDPPEVDASGLVALIGEHNGRVAKHGEVVQEAARLVERHYLEDAAGRVEAALAKSDEAADAQGKLEAELGEIEDEIRGLERVDGNPTPSAERLTVEVARLLGRNELTFTTMDGGHRYSVLRDREPAKGLSVGERTAIALIHFLETVARFDAANGKPIVVIDDPVSSLDSNIFMGISTFIWAETVAKDHVEQVFLLTHSFELFRQWDIQAFGLDKNGGKKSSRPTRMYELRSRHRIAKGRTRREPLLVDWPPSDEARKKVRSGYHHALIAIADAKERLEEDDSLEVRLDAQLLFPNVIRRLLESFLAFKHPETAGDFTGTMRESAKLLRDAGYDGDEDALRLRLTRYAHAYSHNETPDVNEVVNPDEVKTAMAAVFTFMDTLDRGHFRGICEAAGLTPEKLLAGYERGTDEVASAS